MSYIEKIAFHLGRRDEEPNKELATLLSEKRDEAGIDEIASYLNDKNTSIQSDCLKVLYQIGYVAPELIMKYANEFIKLLGSKNNRMVWGAMIALSTIAEMVPEKIFPHTEKILDLIETGTVITNVSGVRTLINLCRAGEPYYSRLRDELMRLQANCRPIDFAKRAEEMWSVFHHEDQREYLEILDSRKSDLSVAARKRLERVMRKLTATQ